MSNPSSAATACPRSALLNRDFALDMWWMEGIWQRVGPAALVKSREVVYEPSAATVFAST